GRSGPVFILRPAASSDALLSASHGGALDKSAFARARDQVGSVFSGVATWKLDTLALSFFGTSLEEERAAVLGLEMAAYSFAENRGNPRRPRKRRPKLLLRQSQMKSPDLRWAADLGVGVNLA